MNTRIQVARLLIPFFAVDILLICALAWQLMSFTRRWFLAPGRAFDVNAARRAACLGLLVAIMVPSEVVLAASDATGAFCVNALLGALLALTSALAVGVCCFACSACQRERLQARDVLIRAHAKGSDQGTRSCRTSSPSRQRGMGGNIIVVMHWPGLRCDKPAFSGYCPIFSV